jgi:hypothetical protein
MEKKTYTLSIEQIDNAYQFIISPESGDPITIISPPIVTGDDEENFDMVYGVLQSGVVYSLMKDAFKGIYDINS